MKKNIFVFSAILVAVVMSAFTFAGNTENRKFANLYWYKVVGSHIDHTQPVNGGTPISKASLLANPSLIPCTVGTSTDCIRGFVTPQTTDPSTGQADFIQKM
jgi:hypothetical protein